MEPHGLPGVLTGGIVRRHRPEQGLPVPPLLLLHLRPLPLRHTRQTGGAVRNRRPVLLPGLLSVGGLVFLDDPALHALKFFLVLHSLFSFHCL